LERAASKRPSQQTRWRTVASLPPIRTKASGSAPRRRRNSAASSRRWL
jgi:hypothetical protein